MEGMARLIIKQIADTALINNVSGLKNIQKDNLSDFSIRDSHLRVSTKCAAVEGYIKNETVQC